MAGPRSASILAINVGSSSVKAGLSKFPGEHEQFHFDLPLQQNGVEDLVDHLADRLAATDAVPIDAIGHRVVHGGDRFEPLHVDAGTLGALDELSALAPLHNPPALSGIRAALARWPNAQHFAVFDTAFHRRMPAVASTYAVPEAWRQAGLRRFGFHGLSHAGVMETVSEALGARPEMLRIVSCHLGNGASACAMDRGVSRDTSMGMTPLEGLVMGTRPGDMDIGAAGHLHRTLGLSLSDFERALNHDCGLAALAGYDGDFRRIEEAAAMGDERAAFAIEAFCYRVRKYIGAYAAAMGGLDVVAFTGGIGERSGSTRTRICASLGFLGIEMDEQRNHDARLGDADAIQVQRKGAAVRVLVVKAREERTIAKHVFASLS